MSRKSRLAVALCALLCSLPAPTFAKHHHTNSSKASGTPGDFDFYLLTLSWAPEFCATHTSTRSSTECDPSRHYGFIVHGLWPENNDGSYPQTCAPAQPVAQAIVQQMLTIMPDRGLIQHEWATHGTCSGLATADYFTAIRKAYAEVQVPQEFHAPARQESVSPANIEQKFASANHAPADAFRVSCSQGEMVAVEACLTKDLQFRSCGSSVRDCRAPQVLVRPTP
jgi:ribonuclease T2